MVTITIEYKAFRTIEKGAGGFDKLTPSLAAQEAAQGLAKSLCVDSKAVLKGMKDELGF